MNLNKRFIKDVLNLNVMLTLPGTSCEWRIYMMTSLHSLRISGFYSVMGIRRLPMHAVHGVPWLDFAVGVGDDRKEGSESLSRTISVREFQFTTVLGMIE